MQTYRVSAKITCSDRSIEDKILSTLGSIKPQPIEAHPMFLSGNIFYRGHRHMIVVVFEVSAESQFKAIQEQLEIQNTLRAAMTSLGVDFEVTFANPEPVGAAKE